VRNGDGDSMQVFLLFVEHLAEVVVEFGAGILEGSPGELSRIHVTKRVNVLTADISDIAAALHAAHANAADVHLLARGRLAGAGQNVSGHDGESGQGSRGGDEIAPGHAFFGVGMVLHGVLLTQGLDAWTVTAARRSVSPIGGN